MKAKVVALFALPLLMSSAFAAQTLTYNVNTINSGVTPSGPAPWAIVTLTGIDDDSLLITVASNIQNNEFISGIGFNLTDGFSYSTNSFNTYNSVGGFASPTITAGADSFNGGAGIKYDVWFSMETNNTQQGINRFDTNDQFSFVFEGSNLNNFISSQDSVGAHIQGLTNGNSVWVGTTNIPEPASILLGGLGLVTLLRRRRG